jgi:uncharacterized protein (TIGR02099 family)
MKRLLRALEVLAWFAFFALAALVLALRYWVLPDIERYRGDIVAAISRAVGLPVKVGGIEAGWSGLRPHITLSDVRLFDRQGREALVLPKVRHVVAWRSLAYGSVHLRSLEVDGPRLAVRRDADGVLYVAGIRISSEPGDGRLTDWVLSQEQVVIRNAAIEWRDERRGAPPLALSALDFVMRNAGDEHSFGLAARTPAELGSTLEVRAQLFGASVADPAAWSGRLYGEIGYTDLAAWRAWVDYPLDVRQGQGALRAWAHVAGGKAGAATADLALAGVVMQLGAAPAPLELASLRGRLQGRVLADGYEVSGRRLSLVPVRGVPLPPSDFRLAWRSGGGSLAAKSLELDALPPLADAVPIPDEVRKLLAEAAPRGQLAEMTFDWSGQLPAPQSFVARSAFDGLGLNAVGRVPGFEGLSGSLEITESRGRLALQSKGAALELPGVFPEPRLALDALAGRIDWDLAGSALDVRIASLAFANRDLAGSAEGSYSRVGDMRGRIDLTARVSRADGAQVARYLPHGRIMGERVRDWLAASIVAGRGSEGSLRLRGDLREFPFREPGSGVFQIRARVSDGVLAYQPGWPRIENIQAELAFDNERMEITGRSGTILGARIADVRVVLPRLVRDGAELQVSGRAEGETSQFVRFMAESPVRGRTGALADTLAATGNGRLQLKLELPLSAMDTAQVAGEYEILRNEVTVHPQVPKVEQVSGKVAFTQSGFTLQGVRGRALGGEVVLRGGTRPGGVVEVQARGEAQLAALKSLVDLPFAERISGGATPYVASFTVREGQTRVLVESPLRGIAFDLPAPLAKRAADALPLRVEIAPAGTRQRVSVALGRIFEAALLTRGEELRRTSVWLTPVAGEPIRLPERPGTLVYGSLARFDADRWLEVLQKDGAAEGAPIGLDLTIGVLEAYGKRVHNLALRAGGEAKGWSAAIKSDEVAGDVTWRSEDGGLLFARLQHFIVPEDVPGPAQAGQPARPRRPTDVPAIDAVIERFGYKGVMLGRVEFLAKRETDAWRFEKLRLASPEATFNARGTWRRGEPSRTALDFDLDATNVGGFLARVGQEGMVKGGRAQASGSLAWDGHPLGIDYASLTGEVDLHAQDGQFLEIDPGIGKLISLMSLQALPRRVALDFRDVFSKGFQFGTINAGARVDSGVMALKAFRMRGSAAEVQMSGRADLAHETQDLKVRVIPSLGDTASTAVAIVNPVAGAAALAVQRVLKDPLGQMFAYDYLVTGSWGDPKIVKLQPVLPPPVTP